ncbi:DNA-binding HxlR family transcriptional regulator [Leucobacter exalbidus]|uniref:DNA-binding HxlR family transcriptional regulator n=1 Tax=Leucobacter exalbidus TaxID=662960 RepID=A0A940T4X3_9MICO|nr:DNA-binding HxlR family transcriptional regulator [Leucobacter exalbidus]
MSGLEGNPYDPNCPTRTILDRIGDRWTVLVVGTLGHGPARFSQLASAVGGVSSKMLTQTLRALERDGLVQRTVYAEVPPRVEYALTDIGQTMREPLSALEHWAKSYVPEVLSAREAYDTHHGVK